MQIFPRHLFTSALRPRWLLNALLFAIAVLLVVQFVVSQRLIYPFDAPDERVHFARAHDVAFAPGVVKLSTAAGKVAVGAFFYDPQPVNECYGKPDCLLSPSGSPLGRLRLEHFFRDVPFQGAAGSDNSFPYAGGNYLHLIPPMRLASLLHFNVLDSYRMARAVSGLLFLGVSALLLFSIHRQRRNASQAFPIALLGLGFWLPSSIFLSNSVSGDYLVTAASVLIALFLLSASWSMPPRLLSFGLMLQPVLYFMVLGKLPYAPIVLASAVLTWLRYPQARSGWFVGASLMSFVLPLWWYGQSRGAVLALFQSQRGDWVGATLTPVELVQWLSGSVGTVVSQFGDLYRQMVAVLGNGPAARLFVPEVFHHIHAVLVLAILGSAVCGTIAGLAPLRAGFRCCVPSRDVMVAVLGVGLSYFMICYGLRLYWTTSYPLDGMQGRYFLPLLPLLVVGFDAWWLSGSSAACGWSSSASRCAVNPLVAPAALSALVVSTLQLIFYLKNVFHFYSASL